MPDHRDNQLYVRSRWICLHRRFCCWCCTGAKSVRFDDGARERARRRGAEPKLTIKSQLKAAAAPLRSDWRTMRQPSLLASIAVVHFVIPIAITQSSGRDAVAAAISARSSSCRQPTMLRSFAQFTISSLEAMARAEAGIVVWTASPIDKIIVERV